MWKLSEMSSLTSMSFIWSIWKWFSKLRYFLNCESNCHYLFLGKSFARGSSSWISKIISQKHTSLNFPHFRDSIGFSVDKGIRSSDFFLVPRNGVDWKRGFFELVFSIDEFDFSRDSFSEIWHSSSGVLPGVAKDWGSASCQTYNNWNCDQAQCILV